MKKEIIVLIAAASLAGGCTKSSVESASNDFNNLPVAVQKSIHAAVPTGEVADVDEDRRDGFMVYKIEFRDSDRHPTIWVAPDGTVLKSDPNRVRDGVVDAAPVRRDNGAQSEFSALPVAVQKAIDDNAPKAEVTSIRRNDQNGTVIYEIEYAGKKRNPTIQVTENGTVIKSLSTDQVSR